MNDVDVALQEIEEWADDPRFVQLVVPAQGLATYGEQRFFQRSGERRRSGARRVHSR